MTRYWTGLSECIGQELWFWYDGPNSSDYYNHDVDLSDRDVRDEDPRFDHAVGALGAPLPHPNDKAASARVNKKFGNKHTRRRSKWSKQRKRKAVGSWRTLLAS